MYKVGDKVRIKNDLVGGEDYGDVYFSDEMNVHAGKIYVIDHVEKTENFTCYTLDGASTWDWSEEMFIKTEKVNEIKNIQKEMTFPEMAQKLIDGKFKVGTELVSDNRRSFWVMDSHITGDFGLTISKLSDELDVPIYGTDINAKWKVKEELIKEMSIEQLQKELGYKIKIVEHSHKGVE